MIIKSGGGEILGLVLPIRLPETIYAELADVLPLKVKWKTELERIKENPTKDPYIGKEFFDGRDTHIISELKEIDGIGMYAVPTVKDGRISPYADNIPTDEIENKIAEWEARRVSRETENPPRPVEKENEEPAAPARSFTHLIKSPWGEVTASEKVCPGVFTVSAEKQGGIMVARDMTAALSPAAVKCGVKYNGFLCFEENGAKEVVLRELLDKRLLAVPGGEQDKAAYEKNINKSIRERQPQYWRSRENRRVTTSPAKTPPAHDDR